jgi:PPOX class probable F420-dependent enzyme
MLTPEARDLFLGPNYAHVATVMSDGSPHTVPVWIDLDDHDRVVFYKENGSVGLKNLKRDPRVAISITDVQNPYRSALVRGRVLELRGEPAACSWLTNLAVSYTGKPYPDPLPGPGTLVVVNAVHVGYHNSANMRHDPPHDVRDHGAAPA